MQLENNLKIYKTNSALGYNQYALLLECNDGYLVVDTTGCYGDDSYKIGSFISNIDSCDFKLEVSDYNIGNSPLWDEYLFQFFIKSNAI